jgi:hypothetical protein
MSKKLIVISLICVMITAATPCVAQTGGLSNDGADAPTETIWLSSPDVSRIEQGWSEAHSDCSFYNRRLTIASRVFHSGIGTHANSTIPLKLDYIIVSRVLL